MRRATGEYVDAETVGDNHPLRHFFIRAMQELTSYVLPPSSSVNPIHEKIPSLRQLPVAKQIALVQSLECARTREMNLSELVPVPTGFRNNSKSRHRVRNFDDVDGPKGNFRADGCCADFHAF